MLWLRALQALGGSGGIVTYHGVGLDGLAPTMHVYPDVLEEQLEFISSRFNVISLEEFVRRRLSGRSNARCVAVTFDDAYLGVKLYAQALMARMSVPATIFVSVNHASTGDRYWWDAMEAARADTGGGSETEQAVLDALKLPVAAGLDGVRDGLLERHGGRWPEAAPLPQAVGEPWRSMTFAEMEELARDESIDFGVHTLSHPALPRLPREEQQEEIRGGFDALAERLPRVRPMLAYPYGMYDGETVVAARCAGMVAAFTLAGWTPWKRDTPWTLPRLGLANVHTTVSIDLRLTSVMRWPLMVRKGGGLRKAKRAWS